MISDMFSIGAIAMQSVLLIVLFGFLIVKYFGKDFRSKSDVGIIFFAFLFWFTFFFLVVYIMFFGMSFMVVYLALLSIIVVLALFTYLNIKYTHLIDWFLVVPEYSLFAILGIFIFKFGYASNFAVWGILGLSSLLLLIGYFIVIRFFIHRGRGL